ncbi:hypothetical protein K4K60_009399 [Colletotrichum sp. SAR11_57]|nr:hypothetical protein K4K60_009399 [Colletotrichum sp. SAR11_57]
MDTKASQPPTSYTSISHDNISFSHVPTNSPTATKVVVVMLNRPEKYNAMTLDMFLTLESFFNTVSEDDRVRAIVLTGEGKAFSAGADLDVGFMGMVALKETEDTMNEFRDWGGRLALAISNCLTMSLPAAIRVAWEGAKVGFPFARRGLVLESCSAFFLPKLIGLSKASHVTTTGNVYPVTDPLVNGLFSKLLPTPQHTVEYALKLAEDIAENTSLVSTKMMHDMMVYCPPTPEEAHILDSRIFVQMAGTNDNIEGVKSFLEKRKPTFTDTNGNTGKDGRKRVLVVGAGAAGMSTAYHLSNHPDKFDVTLIDSVDYCGGQAFSIPLDKERHGASWFNQGVQGGSYIFHHTLTMFARQGYHADPVKLQVSFGKDEKFWSNVFPTEFMVKHQKEVQRLAFMLKFMRWFEVFFALMPLKILFKLFRFSDEFTNVIGLPMTALFLGTGNATPEVPAIMLERLCTSPTYGMWYPPDKHSVASNLPPMVVFPNFSDFYQTWKKDLESRGVTVRLSTELTEIVHRNKRGVLVKTKPRTPVKDGHNPNGGHPDAPESEEHYDDIVMCVLADTAKKILGKTSSWRERKVLGAATFSDDITITHNDADYMKKYYENFYDESKAVKALGNKREVDQSSRLEYAKDDFRPMYYIRMYDDDLSKLEMCFDTTNYQSQFPEKVPFEQHVFQTIYLNKNRDRKHWTDDQINKDKIIRSDWWHQLCHSWTHYAFVVPWIMFLQAKRRIRFAGSWTLVNAHEIAIMSGIAAAVDMGADYPEDLEHDKFALLCFRLYYLLSYGKWYRRKFKNSKSQKAKDGAAWASGLYGSVYKGPGVTKTERLTWREEVKAGRSTENLAEGNNGRSQP